MDEKSIKQAEALLARQDPLFGKLIQSQTLKPRAKRNDYFESLCRSIIGQQVSVKAAAAIFERFKTATNLQPQKVLNLSEEQIKIIGLSKQKTNYITDLARHFVNDPNVYNHLESQTDKQVISELTNVKGIGEWTAQMFLMFTLGRSDIFAPDDAGLQRAMQKLYGWETVPPKKELNKTAQKWIPYRTIACLHLWQSLDNTPD